MIARCSLVLLLLFNVKCVSSQSLTNTGFEGNYLNTAPGWTSITWGSPVPANADYNRELAQVHGGVSSQQIIVHSFGDGSTMLVQNIDFPAGQIFEGSIWMRSDSLVKVAFMFQERVPFYFVPAAYIAEVDTVWRLYTIRGGFRSSTSTNNQLIQGRFVIQPLDTGTFYVDDASFTDITMQVYNAPVADTGIIPRTYFGMHVNKLGVHQTYPDVGFGMMRLWNTGTNWAEIEPTQGVLPLANNWIYDASGNSGFGFRMEYYDSYRNNNDPSVRLIYTMGQTPAWSAPYVDMPPANYADWSNYASVVGHRFQSRIPYWEPWNEADIYNSWSGTPAELVALCGIAYDTLKAVDSSNVVLTANFVSAEGMAKHLDAGGGVYADVISWHHYPSQRPEESIAEIVGIQSVMTNYGFDSLPLWNTEGAVSFPYTDTLSSDAAAGTVSRTYILQWAFGVKNFNWYCWDIFGDPSVHNFVQLSHSATPNQYDSITPAGIAYRETSSWLTGAQMMSKSYSNGVWIIELKRANGYSGHIVWSTTGAQQFSIPAAWNAVQYRDLSGSTWNTSGTVAIGEKPVLIDNGPLSVQETPTVESTVFPNPFTEAFTVLLSNSDPGEIYQLEVFGPDGTIVHSQSGMQGNRFEVNAESWASGLYFYRLTAQNGRVLSGKILAF